MKNILHQAESLVGHFKPINLDCAYTIAYALEQHDTKFVLDQSNIETTVRQLYAGTAYGMPAERIHIRFYGGPVGRGTWHKGTLYTFILDCTAAKIQMEGFERTRQLLRVKHRA